MKIADDLKSVEPQQADRRDRKDRVGVAARWLLPSIGSISLLLVLYLLIVCSFRFLLDGDTGWHIRTGQMILATGTVPRVDPFSHTLGGSQWFAWEWLTDVLMALVYQWRGLAGLVGAAMLVLLISYAALYQIMMRRGSDPLIACAVTVLGALCGIVHWLARPHLVSILLMIGWLAAVEGFRRKRKRWIFLLPLLTGLWANLHGAFASTFVMFAVYAVGEWLEFASRREWWSRRVRRVLATYAAVGLLSALAALLTPYGAGLYRHLWRYLTDRELLSSIQEFQSPNFHSLDGKLIEVLLLFGTIAAVNALRSGRFVESGLVLLWGHMTLQSERHVTLAVVVMTPMIAEQLTLLASELAGKYSVGAGSQARALRAVREWYGGNMRIDGQLTGGLVYAGILVFFIFLTGKPLADKLLSPQFKENRFPVAAADYILEKRPAGNLYSSDQFGSYLIYRLYPDFKVFVDGRSDFYRQGAVLEDMSKLVAVSPQWSELLDKYDVQWMVLKPAEPLAQIALSSGRWENFYQDSTARILIRKKVPGLETISGPTDRGN